jgi:hypothetical protein
LDYPENKAGESPEWGWAIISGSFWKGAIIILLVWGAAIFFIDPRGEFMVNDDWSFVKILEGLEHGKMIATGWGPGGPSAIVHVLWGKLFTSITGFSLTNLRLSVILIGMLGSLSIFLLLLLTTVSPEIALIGALTIVLNPLFMAESFSFMTDVTFASLLSFSVLFVYLGVEKDRLGLLIAGLIFALMSILTRQIGIVLPLGLLVASIAHPKGRRIGVAKIAALVILITIGPWLTYEFFLHEVGSTPLTEHDVIRNITEVPKKLGLENYLTRLFSLFVLVGMGYTSFFLFPLVAAGYKKFVGIRLLRCAIIGATVFFTLFELGIIVGAIHPPVELHRNVIFDFGIGPILLKDTYVLGIQRTVTLPPSLYYLIVYVAVISGLTLLYTAVKFCLELASSYFKKTDCPCEFISALTLACAVIYWGIIGLTGFHDRYLIPLVMLVVIWLSSTYLKGTDIVRDRRVMIAPCLALVALGAITFITVHDFMETKRTILKAQNYVTDTLGVKPCDFDGGFEFNGYHCYDKSYNSGSDRSWWWVFQEKFVIAMGPLPGYEVVKSFPISRILDRNSSICVLKPDIELKGHTAHEPTAER